MDKQMTFGQLRIGAEFDFINDAQPMYNSFYKRCTKITPRKYADQDGVEYRIGSVSAKVYHVFNMPVEQESELERARR